MKSQVTVVGKKAGQPRQHRITILFNVDYRYHPTEVISAVTAAIIDDPIPNVAGDPSPHCLLWDFKDSYACYNLRYWRIDQAIAERTDSLIRCRIYYALKRMGITIAIPAYRTFQTDENVARRDRIAAENLAKRLAAIARVDIFQPLNEQERQALAQSLQDTPFARGEAMAQQGAKAECMYIITQGSAEVLVHVPGADGSKLVATLGVGDFFGEMGLMTGDVRSASVMAAAEVHCFRLDKEPFNAILTQRPEIAEAISQILARRRVELDAVKEHLADQALKNRLNNTQTDLLARIRKFFTLERPAK
jgi:CRP-like cAMP-binding protein